MSKLDILLIKRPGNHLALVGDGYEKLGNFRTVDTPDWLALMHLAMQSAALDAIPIKMSENTSCIVSVQIIDQFTAE